MDTFAPAAPIVFGYPDRRIRREWRRGLMETVTYFLRPHIVTREAYRAGQAIAKAQADRALGIAEEAVKRGHLGGQDGTVRHAATGAYDD